VKSEVCGEVDSANSNLSELRISIFQSALWLNS